MEHSTPNIFFGFHWEKKLWTEKKNNAKRNTKVCSLCGVCAHIAQGMCQNDRNTFLSYLTYCIFCSLRETHMLVVSEWSAVMASDTLLSAGLIAGCNIRDQWINQRHREKLPSFHAGGTYHANEAWIWERFLKTFF